VTQPGLAGRRLFSRTLCSMRPGGIAASASSFAIDGLTRRNAFHGGAGVGEHQCAVRMLQVLVEPHAVAQTPLAADIGAVPTAVGLHLRQNILHVDVLRVRPGDRLRQSAQSRISVRYGQASKTREVRSLSQGQCRTKLGSRISEVLVQCTVARKFGEVEDSKLRPVQSRPR
jgi:hypothetical protein